MLFLFSISFVGCGWLQAVVKDWNYAPNCFRDRMFFCPAAAAGPFEYYC